MKTLSNSKKSQRYGKLKGIWRTYDNTNGLLAGVNRLLQDHKGFLWLATYGGGVSCFDGVQFTNYTTADGLPHNDIRALCRDSRDRLWFGTRQGHIGYYENGRFEQCALPAGFEPYPVYAICEDADGNLWFSTEGGGVLCGVYPERSRRDGLRFSAFTTENGLAGNVVWALYRDSRDRLWIGARGGLHCYEGGKFTTYTAEDGLSHPNVAAICEDSQGRLWLGGGRGLFCYDGEKFTHYTTEDGLAHNEIWALYWDRSDRLWVGAFGGGVTCGVYPESFGSVQDKLRRRDGIQFVVYTTQDGLPAECVTGILQDKEGNFWFAIPGCGLTQFDPESFQILCEDSVNTGAFTKDLQERLWYGSYYQLGCIKEEEVKRRRMPAQIHDLLADQEGGLWLATWGEGVYYFRDRETVWSEEPEHFTTEHGLTDLRTLSLAQDRASRIWVGAENGDLYCYEGGRFKKVVQHQGVIGTLLEDSSGNLWMGGFWGGGLACLHGAHRGVKITPPAQCEFHTPLLFRKIKGNPHFEAGDGCEFHTLSIPL